MVKVILPKVNSVELAEETGIHIGDGSMNIYANGGMVSIAGHPRDDREHYVEFIVPLYEKLYNITPRLRPWSGAYGFQVCSTELVTFKNKMGLPLGPKKNISVPSWIMGGTEDWKAACLRGMFDTDGTFYVENKGGQGYPRIQLRTASENLAKDIYSLMKQLGLRPSKWMEKPKNPAWSLSYAVAVRGNEQIERWMGAIGSSNPKNKRKYERWKRSINKKKCVKNIG